MPLKNLGKLRAETGAQREAGAKVGEADVTELRARMEAFEQVGEVLNEAGVVSSTSAATTRALFFAESVSSGVFGEFMDWLNGQSR